MRVVHPGLATTLQDHGRRAGLESGVPPGGAADSYAYRINCLVLGNSTASAVIEQVLKGGRYEAVSPVTVALTGADMSASVNGRSVPMAAPVDLRPGDVLETGIARIGCFGYLGVAGGGFHGDRVFGSVSTYLDGQLGGLEGRILRAGDVLSRHDSEVPAAPMRAASAEHQFLCTPPTELRFTRGPQEEYFSPTAYGAFTSHEYQVSPRSNRVGYRINGSCPPVLPVPRTRDTGHGPTDIVEEGNPVGGIQVAGGQEIICLGRDCGTSGAYAKIGCLISADVSRLAQLAPGRPLRFTEVTVAQARQIRADYEAVIASIGDDDIGRNSEMPNTSQAAVSQIGAAP
jgi:biotin-dependent carboxylase-like uncharacterized protein